MYIETISREMLELSKRLDFLKKISFYLSGGTGLALQLGHRRSFDMDFFTPEKFSPEELSSLLRRYNLKMTEERRSFLTLYCLLEGIRVSFMYYEGRLLFPLKDFNSISVADFRDIIAEKARTIADRGKKKDFYDFYYGVKLLGIERTVELICKKFGRDINYLHIMKGLTYFEDAERDPSPILLESGTGWDEIKDFFEKNIKDFEKFFARYQDTIS